MKRSAFRLAILSLAVSLTGAFAGPAVAQPEKILDHVTGWTYLYGVSGAQVNEEVAAGRRPITIRRAAASLYDVVTVANSGSYAVSGFGTGNMHYNVSLTQLSNDLSGRRLISIDCRTGTFNRTFVTAISVPNTGSGSVGWGWLVDTTRQNIINWVNNSATPLRIVDLSIYERDGQKYYAAVAVYNTGSQFQNWWWYFDVTASQVASLLQQNNARLLTIKVETPASTIAGTRYAVVMVAQNPGAGWFYGGLTSDQIASTIAQTGGRLTNLHRYTTTGGTTRFAVSLVDNANPQTRRVRDLLVGNLSQGTYGFKLKRVDGAVAATLNEHFVFEPASTLKILHAAYAMRQAALNLPGSIALEDSIWVPNRCTTDFWRDACPSTDYSCNSGNELLQATVRSMMRASHNGRTRTIEDLFGRATLNYFASASGGMLNTQINHYIGCGTPANTTTCDDMVRLYERISDGTLFNNEWRNTLAWQMQALRENGWGGGGRNGFSRLNQIINEEAAGTNLVADELNAFRDAMQVAHKIGGYWDGGGVNVRSSVAGWAQIPHKLNSGGNWVTQDRDYAFSIFVSGALNGENEYIYTHARLEVLREQIRAALLSWDAACSPGIAQHPASVTVDEGENAQFAVTAGGVGAAEYQWQRFVNGIWASLGNVAGQYSGVTTNTLTVLGARPSQEGSYRCRVIKICGTTTSNPGTLTVNPAGPTSAPIVLPTHLVLHAPAPNPFNPQVSLRFELPRQTDLAVLEVFDVAGRRVRTLQARSLPAGAHTFTWNGTDDTGRRRASGVYLARLRAGGETVTQRLVMVE